MNREQVYKMIDSERDYQDWRWESGKRKDRIMDEKKSVAEWVNYIEFHLNLAKEHLYMLRKDDALEEVRKITGLGVACMENNYTKSRLENYKDNV